MKVNQLETILTIMFFSMNHALKLTLLILSGIVVSGCASFSQQNNIEDSQVSQNQNTEQSLVIEDQALPNLELDVDLLEQLLIVNFATQYEDWSLAASNALAAAKSSQDYRLARLTALLALRAEEYQYATQGAELWLELQEDEMDALTTLLRARLEAGDIDGAVQGFQLRLSRQPIAIDEHIKEVAALLVRQKNIESAVGVLQHYFAEYPDSAQVALSSAYVAERFKREDLTEEWLDYALTLRPDWDLAAQMKAAVLARQEKNVERSEYIADFVAAYPSSIGMRINFAAELARDKKYQEALTLMQQVLTDAPDNVSGLNYSAALAQQLKQEELAKDYYRRALKLDPSNDEVRWALARYAVLDEKYLNAERHYLQIKSADYYFQAQLQVANMRYYTRGLKGAISTLRLLEPKTEQEYVARATTRHYLLLQDYQYEEAFGAINETLAYLPDNLELIYARALVAAELNQLQTVEDDLRFILKRNPKHVNALNALGYTLADQTDRFEEAKKLVSQALELRPNQAHILDSMGWVLYRLDDFEQAVDFLQRAYDKAPEVEVAAHLGEVLWEKGEQEKARQVWSKAFSIDNKNPLLNETLERYGIELE